MTTDRAMYWVDVELDSPLTEDNHQEFVELLNESVNQIVDADKVLPEAVGKTPGIRVILPETPGDTVIDRLSFLYSGFKHQGIAMSFVVRNEDSLNTLEISESALFNRLMKKFYDT